MSHIKKTKNIWSVICKKSIVDEQTKLISLIDIVERLILDIDIDKAPTDLQDSFKKGRFIKPIQVPENITVASYWALQDDHRGVELQVETIIKDEEGENLASGVLQFTTNTDHTNYRTFFTLPAFPITGSGIYQIESILKSNEGEVIATGTTPITIDLNNIKTN